MADTIKVEGRIVGKSVKSKKNGKYAVCGFWALLPLTALGGTEWYGWYSAPSYSWFTSIDGVCQAHASHSTSLSPYFDYSCEDTDSNRYVVERSYNGIVRGGGWFVAALGNCASGEAIASNGSCSPDVKCPSGYSYNSTAGMCEAWCSADSSWDAANKVCDNEPVAESCEDRTANPIDLIAGQKYRTEEVISVGNKFPIRIKYFYNSRRRFEFSGISAYGKGQGAYLADSIPPVSTENPHPAADVYDEIAFGEFSDFGATSGYWRHNYQDVLYLRRSGKFSWHRVGGNVVLFAADGTSGIYPAARMNSLSQEEASNLGYSGHTVQLSKNSDIRIFDDLGRLRRVVDSNTKLYQDLIYDDQSQLVKIEHSLGYYIEIESIQKNRQYLGLTSEQVEYFPSTFTSSNNKVVTVFWENSYSGQLKNYWFITRITRVSEHPGREYREYQYADVSSSLLLTKIVDVTNRETGEQQEYASFAYDDEGRAISSSLAGGVDQVTVVYDDSLTRTVTNSLGRDAAYTYSVTGGAKRLTSVVGEPTATCLQSETSYTYNANGTRSEKLSNGTRTLYSYNSRGLEISRTEAAGTADEITTTTEWHPDFNRPTKVSTPNRTTRYVYDSNELLKEMHIDADGETRTTLYTYYPNRLLQSVDGPRTDVNDITSYTYDSQLNLATVTNALNHTVTYSQYNSQGQVGKVVDANGVISLINYTLTGEVASVTRVHPTDSTRSVTTDYTYNPLGQLESVSLPGGATIYYHYDQARRLEAISNNLGERLDYSLDLAGNITEETIKNSSGTIVYQVNRAYDELSRLMDIVGAVNESAHFTYDADDNLTSATNGRNHTTTYQYDNLNRLKTVLEPLQQTTGFEYNSSGELTRVTDAETLETHYDVNGFGEVETRTSPDTGVTTYTYDEAGNVSSQTDAANGVTQYQYDALNRLTHVLYPAAPAENVIYSYDDTTDGNHGIGRLTGVTDNSGETRLTYNYLGRLIKEEYRIQSQWFTTHYQYDDYGRQVGVRYPSGRQVNLYRDSLSRVDAITTQENALAPVQAVVSNVAYLPYGPVVSWSYGNGISHQRSYDLSYRMTGIQEQAGQALYNISYAYDGNSNITSLTNLINAAASQVFGYDAVDRLDSAVGNYGDIGYQYDGVGNRTGKTLTAAGSTTSETYLYQADSHRLDTVSDGTDTTQFSYDAKGNLTGRATGQQQQSWDYNTANRPQQVTTPAATVNFLHNAQGQRVYQQTAGNERYFHFGPGGQLLAVSDGAGNYQEEYLYLNKQTIAVIQPAPVTAP